MYTRDTCPHCDTRMENHSYTLIIIEGQFRIFQRFASSKLVPKTVYSSFAALNYYENGCIRYYGLHNNWHPLLGFQRFSSSLNWYKKQFKAMPIILQVAVHI
jgi:hypothetical protein